MLPTLELDNDSRANVDPRSMHWFSESDGNSKDGKLDLEGDRDIEGTYFTASESGGVYFSISTINQQAKQLVFLCRTTVLRQSRCQ